MITTNRLRTKVRQRIPAPMLRPMTALAHRRPAHRAFVAQQRALAAERSAVDDQVIALLGTTKVCSGPFAGMHLQRDTVWGADFSARLLGTYEQELHATIRDWASDTVLVVDVGCADGYYAVGMALLAPQAKVRAFDIDPAAVAASLGLARVNAVQDRVTAEGRCSPEALMSLPDGSVVIMDCEGAERQLITSSVVDTNPGTRFIIECHDSIIPGTTTALLSLFNQRRATLVQPTDRQPQDAAILPSELALQAMDERRDQRNPWLVIG